MKITPTVTTNVTLDLLAWHESGSLELSPKFQRRPVWRPAAKSYFIDTMLRGYPIPPIHVRISLRSSGEAHREIIDGQQRLRAVFDFVAGRFRLSRNLAGPWAGKLYGDLDEAERARISMFKFHGFEYESLDDPTVLEIFARINTYSVALTKQELRNGKFFGVFKTSMYGLALDHLQFWRQTKLFTETSIARMNEVEFISELAIMLLDGIQDKKKTIDAFYRNLDEAWGKDPVTWTHLKIERPKSYASRKEIETQVGTVLAVIGEHFADVVLSTSFSRPPLFYSLFSAIAHRMYGLPGELLESPHKPLTAENIVDLRDALTELAALVSEKPPLNELTGRNYAFLSASSRQTDNLGPRRERLQAIWDQAALGS